MSSKFDKVPVEEDTRILFKKKIKLGEHDVLYQKWFWDGIAAESIIFANDDITGLGKGVITRMVKSSSLLNKDSEMTFIKSDSGFTFVNFNFEIK